MPDIKVLHQQEASLNVINDFVSAYQRLTIYQMQQKRTSVINNRVYTNGLLDAFIDVKKSAASLFKTKEDAIANGTLQFSTLAQNERRVAVFISFETKFSAETVYRTFEYFAQNVNKDTTDIVITGIRGKQLFPLFFPEDAPFTFFDLKESELSSDAQVPVIKHLLSYKHVDVYHPFFVSILQQVPTSSNISGEIILDENLQLDRQRRNFLFEPNRAQITHFFEIQIFAALFNQQLKEAHLATLASRITTLQSTEQNLQRERAIVARKKVKRLRSLENKKQRNRLAGMNFWHKA